MLNVHGFRVAGWLALVVLTGCAAPQRPAVPPPEELPPAAGIPYQVVAAELVLRVYRDGPLARFGHNHIIASTGLTGTVLLREPLEMSSLVIELPLESLVVDEPERRRAAGEDFAPDVPEADRAATRANMLGEQLLNAAAFPVITVRADALAAVERGYRVQGRVTLAGRTVGLELPAELTFDGDRLQASGELVLSHAELGLKPFSVAMGALRVRDDIGVSYRFTAERQVPGS